MYLVKQEIQNSINCKQKMFTSDIAALQENLLLNFASKSDLAATKSEIKIEIAEVKAEILKSTFVVVFSSTILSITSILTIIKFFLK